MSDHQPAEQPIPAIVAAVTARRERAKRIGRVVVPFLVALVTTAGTIFAVLAFSPDLPTAMRVVLALGALLLFALPGRIVYVLLRRRHKTGQWTFTPTPEERLRLAASRTRLRQPRTTEFLIKWMDLLLLPLFAFNAWQQLRTPHGTWDWAYGLLWVFLAFNSAHTLYKQLRRPTQPTAA